MSRKRLTDIYKIIKALNDPDVRVYASEISHEALTGADMLKDYFGMEFWIEEKPKPKIADFIKAGYAKNNENGSICRFSLIKYGDDSWGFLLGRTPFEAHQLIKLFTPITQDEVIAEYKKDNGGE